MPAETAAVVLVVLVIGFFIVAGSVQNLDRPRATMGTPLWLCLTLVGESNALAYGYNRILVRGREPS